MEFNDDAFIKKIKDINLKELSSEELNNLSDEIREYIIKACSINGGHLASNLGVVELTIALHRFFDFPKDKLIFDVGHQCYTHKVLTGRSLLRLRKEDGVGGFQKRQESEYDPFDAGHSSTSISAAMGMAVERDLKGEKYDVIAVIGDASIANGMAFEALNNLVHFNHKIIIIINDNNMSISNSTGALHDFLQKIRLSTKYTRFKHRYQQRLAKNFFTKFIFKVSRRIKNCFKKLLLRNNIFEMFGCYYIGNVNGHDFSDLKRAFNKAKKIDSSVVIHVSTIKGKGYEYIEENNVSSWHSVKPFDVETGNYKATKKDGEYTWSEIYADFLKEEIETGNSILINPATMVGSKIQKIYENHKNKVFDVGISEEHALTFAAGFSAFNSHSYVSIYSSFMQRAYDQINHDIARLNLPVTLLIDRSGLVGEDGETHQGIFDESFLLNMPNMSVCMAKDYAQAKSLFLLSKTYEHPLAIRYPLGSIRKDVIEDENIEFGKWIVEHKGTNKKVCVITFGPKTDLLLNENLDITLINAVFQSPLDEECLKSLLDYENIIIYDAYAIKEGFCYHVLAKLTEYNYKNNVKMFAIKNQFITKATIEKQEIYSNADINSVLNYIKELINTPLCIK